MSIIVSPRFEPHVRTLLRYLRRVDKAQAAIVAIRMEASGDGATKGQQRKILVLLDDMQVALAAYEKHLGNGALMAEIAKAQIAMLRALGKANNDVKKKGRACKRK